MKNLLLLSVLVIALSGCSYIDSVFNPSPNIVAGLESSLAAADSAALAYVTLPKCGSNAANGSVICSNTAVVKNIGIAAEVAYTAVKAAEANETSDTVQAAENAINAYQTIVSALK